MAIAEPSSLAILRVHPGLADVSAKLFYWTATEHDLTAYLQQALTLVCETLEGEYLAIAKGEKGQWRTLGSSGPRRPLPTELLAEVLDRDLPAGEGDWYVAPLSPGSQSGEMLAAFRLWSKADAQNSKRRFEALSEWLRIGVEQIRTRQQERDRATRLQAILEIAAQWQQTHEMNPLLVQMAETAIRLLSAERASIFLWDKANRTLVGRPALGVEGGELRIPDDAGIVGQTVQSGEPRRVDADVAIEQREIDRRVDRNLKFETRSLLAVPLRGSSGELFGAFELINKIGGNFTDEDQEALTELAAHAAVALENTQELEKLLSTKRQVAEQAAQGVQLIGNAPAIVALRSTVRRVAETELAVLVLGENGTGKEVVAQMVHYHSLRRSEPFVAVNCAALTETLLESELFGHEKGAFTDARETRQGKFELAASGTLFLDEIGDMSLGGQAKLLRVLEEKVVVRVGGSASIPTNARVIAATNQSLADLVRARKFREDLYFRLNVVTLELPPLRERDEDVVLLAEHFLKHFSALARRKPLKFTAAAKKRLLAHDWPGNVRELRNLMERLAYLSAEDQDKLDAPDLAFIMSPGAARSGGVELDATLSEGTRQFQIEFIQQHIQRARGNMTTAAERLGLHRSNLYRKMRQLGMDVAEE
ncbi:MAG: sigma-54-dependent Fis family transcriptional regulator [Pirellulaceae bacterium]|nr:sigma-54-dependent Fis family transcriptional regulator [Pirellulaceae bacterium]